MGKCEHLGEMTNSAVLVISPMGRARTETILTTTDKLKLETSSREVFFFIKHKYLKVETFRTFPEW